MSLRDYAGHKAGCGMHSGGCRECFVAGGPRKLPCPNHCCECTCGLDKALAAHDERERRIETVIRRASDPLIRRCAETYAILEGLLEEIEALEDGR